MSKNSRKGSAGAVLMFLPDAWIAEGNNSLKEIKLNGCMTSRQKFLPVSLADPKMMTQMMMTATVDWMFLCAALG